jgi:hypothetical protein
MLCLPPILIFKAGCKKEVFQDGLLARPAGKFKKIFPQFESKKGLGWHILTLFYW